MSISTSRRWRMRSVSGGLAALLIAAATGCLDGLDPPFDAEATELECSGDPEERYLSAAGSLVSNGVALSDGDPPAAIQVVHDSEDEPGLAVIGSSQEGDYQFYILNFPAIVEGTTEVVRSSIEEPDGVRLVIELERRSLGSVALDSLEGEITFETVSDEELSGHFRAAFGTLTDKFQGCFHVDVVSTDAASR
jgi:hypothetical protein